MSISSEQLQPVVVGNQEHRVEALRLLLGYPSKQHDPEGSRFWFLRQAWMKMRQKIPKAE